MYLTVKMTKFQSNKQQRKKRASSNAIKEIKAEQKSTKLIIPVAPVNRLISEIAKSYRNDVRFKDGAYRALQVALESHMISLFEKANLCAIHSDRETVQSKDIQLALKMLE